jgi:hypothetical protein
MTSTASIVAVVTVTLTVKGIKLVDLVFHRFGIQRVVSSRVPN